MIELQGYLKKENRKSRKPCKSIQKFNMDSHGCSQEGRALDIPVPILSSGSEICFNSRSSNLQKKIE